MAHLPRLALSAAMLALLAGCGGGDEGGGEAQIAPPQQDPGADRVIDAIEKAAATRNGDDCARLATPGYLEQREHRSGDAALDACQAGVFDRDRGLLDGPVQVGDVEVKRGTAAAEVTLGGDGYAGLTARLRLVRGWKLDRIEDFVDPHRIQLERLLRSEVASGQIPFSKGAADCALDDAEALPDAELEAVLLSKSTRGIYAPVVSCARPEVVDLVLDKLAAGSALVPAPLLDCAKVKLTALGEPRLVRLLVDRDLTAAVRVLFRCNPRAMLGAYRIELTNSPYRLPHSLIDCVVGRLQALSKQQLVRVFTDDGIEPYVDACRSAKGK